MHVNPWKIEMLGWLRATRDDEVIERFSTHKTAALLARLAYYAGRDHPREELVEWLWPQDPDRGGQSLRQSLTTLRRLLELPGIPRGVVLVTTRTTVRVNDRCVHTDVAEFDSILKATAAAGNGAQRAILLARAVELCRGELLPGFYDDWALTERRRLVSALAGAMRQLVDWHLESATFDVAAAYANRWLAFDPIDENACLAAMKAEVGLGQFGAVVRRYEDYKDLLYSQLGAQSGPSIQ